MTTMIPVQALQGRDIQRRDTALYGLFPSRAEALAQAQGEEEKGKEHDEPLQWHEAHIHPDSGPCQLATGCSKTWAASCWVITRDGNASATRQFDAAVLQMAAEVLKDRFGAITTDIDRAALQAAARELEAGRGRD